MYQRSRITTVNNIGSILNSFMGCIQPKKTKLRSVVNRLVNRNLKPSTTTRARKIFSKCINADSCVRRPKNPHIKSAAKLDKAVFNKLVYNKLIDNKLIDPNMRPSTRLRQQRKAMRRTLTRTLARRVKKQRLGLFGDLKLRFKKHIIKKRVSRPRFIRIRKKKKHRRLFRRFYLVFKTMLL
jgi:hypothetical protein